MKNKMTVTELARLGGKARGKLPKEELTRIGKLGGRPKKLDKKIRNGLTK